MNVSRLIIIFYVKNSLIILTNIPRDRKNLNLTLFIMPSKKMEMVAHSFHELSILVNKYSSSNK